MPFSISIRDPNISLRGSHILPTNGFTRQIKINLNKYKSMTLFVSLIVISADTFSQHYCQPKAYLPPLILMATFLITAF